MNKQNDIRGKVLYYQNWVISEVRPTSEETINWFGPIVWLDIY
jgi:hypothetical protein